MKLSLWVWDKAARALDRAAKFDYFRLIPNVSISKNERRSFGVEFTFRHVGPGIGFGLGKTDLWVGWPKVDDSCQTHEKCLSGQQ